MEEEEEEEEGGGGGGGGGIFWLSYMCTLVHAYTTCTRTS